MSVQPGPTFKRYAANGVTTVYTIPFLLISDTDLQITLNGALVTVGFTLAGIGSATSSCTFAVPPTGDLLFQLVATFQRLSDYQLNGDFLSPTVNLDFDRLWLAVKELRRDDGRSLVVSPLEPEGIPALPVIALRGLKLLAFDAYGAPVPSNLTLDQIEQQPALALASAQTAAAAALAAANSSASAGGYSVAAQAWANTPVNTVVSGGLYSALHWATKSAASATAAATSASNAAATLAGAVMNTGAQTMAGPLTVTGGIPSIPFNKEFVSSQQVMVGGGGITLAHGFGVEPKFVQSYFVCSTASDGYAVGDKVMLYGQAFDSAATSQTSGTSYRFDTTNIYIRFGQLVANMLNNTTGVMVPYANALANFRLVVRAWA